jgi:nucleotide-binding universal stress UspA family protein
MAISRTRDAEQIFVHVGRDSEPTRKRLAEVFAQGNVALDPESLLVRNGKPDSVILNAARERDVDMIVIGALERDSVVRELIGSTARRVARRARCSVFLLVGPVDEFAPWRNLVASVRYDEASAELLGWLAALAKPSPRARIHVIREYDPYGGVMVEEDARGGISAGENPGMRAAEEKFLLANFLEGIDMGPVPVTSQCLVGRSGAELLRYSLEVEADLIALTAPDRALGLWDRFFGHPVEAILQRLPCTLLIHRGGAMTSGPAER